MENERRRGGRRNEMGGKFESRQRGGLITQRGTRGEIDERKEQRALARESIVGEKDSCYSLCKQRKVQRAGKKEQMKRIFFSVGQRKENLSCSGSALF